MNATRTRNSKSRTSTRGSQRKSGQGKGAQSRGAAAKKSSRAQPRGASTQGRRGQGSSAGERGGSASARKGSSSTRGGSSQRGRSSKSSAGSRGSRTPIGQAIEILMADHKMVQQMFRQAERAKQKPQQLREIVEAACAALTLHTEIEEQHFYPMMREAIDDGEMISEAYIEHASAKQLIAQLQGGDPEDEEYAARFKVLGEYVKHHIKEEENEIFPKARRARADFEPLLEALVARDEAVLAEGAEEEEMAAGTNGGGGRARKGARKESQSGRAGSRSGTSGQGQSSLRGSAESSSRGGSRGRQGRGRGAEGGEAGGEDQSTTRIGGSEGESDVEQPTRRGRSSRTQQDTGDLESGEGGRESESEETDTRGSTQGGR